MAWRRALVAGVFNLVADVAAAAGVLAAVVSLARAPLPGGLTGPLLAAECAGLAAVSTSLAVLVASPGWRSWPDAALAAGLGGALAQVLRALSHVGLLGALAVAVAGRGPGLAALLLATGVLARLLVRPVLRTAAAVVRAPAGWERFPGVLPVALGARGLAVALGEALLSLLTVVVTVAGVALVLAGTVGAGLLLGGAGLWMSSRLRRWLARGIEGRLEDAARGVTS